MDWIWLAGLDADDVVTAAANWLDEHGDSSISRERFIEMCWAAIGGESAHV